MPFPSDRNRSRNANGTGVPLTDRLFDTLKVGEYKKKATVTGSNCFEETQG